MGRPRLAFIKFAGLASSGVEKYVQTLAMLLQKTGQYSVDFFYTNAAPFLNSDFVHPDNCQERKRLMEEAGVTLKPIHVSSIVGNLEPHEWIDTDFWSHFKEDDYDFLTTGRSGYPQYPFNLINKLKTIDTIHSFIGSGDKPNTIRAILQCNWAADKWASSGGDYKKVVIIPTVVYIPEKMPTDNLRSALGIPEDAFVYGFHQGARAGMFNPTSLNAYAKISNKNNYFIVMGADPQYRVYAHELGLKNIFFINSSSKLDNIHKFLNTINVFAHSRSDGEVCSACMIEALSHGLPILSHPALNMGHVEQIGNCGIITDSIEDYAKELQKLEQNTDYYKEKSFNALENYNKKFEYKMLEQRIIDLYGELAIEYL